MNYTHILLFVILIYQNLMVFMSGEKNYDFAQTMHSDYYT